MIPFVRFHKKLCDKLINCLTNVSRFLWYIRERACKNVILVPRLRRTLAILCFDYSVEKIFPQVIYFVSIFLHVRNYNILLISVMIDDVICTYSFKKLYHHISVFLVVAILNEDEDEEEIFGKSSPNL